MSEVYVLIDKILNWRREKLCNIRRNRTRDHNVLLPVYKFPEVQLKFQALFLAVLVKVLHQGFHVWTHFCFLQRIRVMVPYVFSYPLDGIQLHWSAICSREFIADKSVRKSRSILNGHVQKLFIIWTFTVRGARAAGSESKISRGPLKRERGTPE